MVIHTEEIRILGDLAYSHGTLEYEITPKEGGETRSYSVKFLDVLEKQVDGSWKIAIDCHNYNSDRNTVAAIARSNRVPGKLALSNS